MKIKSKITGNTHQGRYDPVYRLEYLTFNGRWGLVPHYEWEFLDDESNELPAELLLVDANM